LRVPEFMNLEDDIALLKSAVLAGGVVAHDFFKGHAETWEKNPGDPVTEADLAVDALLKEKLCSARPDYGWLSEETVDDSDRMERQRCWIVDPIDGTRAFVQRKPEYTVCAALVEDGKPVLGAVLNPETNDFWFAELGQGATLNDEPLELSPVPAIVDARLLSSSGMLQRNGHLPIPKSQFHFHNSIAFRMALVAQGRYDATISVQPKCDWDIAAADLICTEAGYEVTTPDGKDFTYNQSDVRHTGIIVAGKPLHAELLERLDGIELNKERRPHVPG
jgi:myo-inositol-1(or 4)-monophosphatase